MKKNILSLIGMLSVCASVQAGIITGTLTNLSSGGGSTNVLVSSARNVNSVSVYSPQGGLVSLYDSATNTLLYYVGAYSYVSNITASITNLQTNGIYVFGPTNGVYWTNYSIQTNVVTGNWRTNMTISGTTSNLYPIAISVAVGAGQTATLDQINLNFVRGIAATCTASNATIVIYTKD